LGVFHKEYELLIKRMCTSGQATQVLRRPQPIEALFEPARQSNAHEVVGLQEDQHTHLIGVAQSLPTIAAKVILQPCLDHNLHGRLAPLQLLRAIGVPMLIVGILLHAMHQLGGLGKGVERFGSYATLRRGDDLLGLAGTAAVWLSFQCCRQRQTDLGLACSSRATLRMLFCVGYMRQATLRRSMGCMGTPSVHRA